MTEATLTSFSDVWVFDCRATPLQWGVLPKHISPSQPFPFTVFSLHVWKSLMNTTNADFLPSYHSWSVGGKTDALRCWLVHRHHTGLPLFLTDFSLPPRSHFYQQQSAWSQSQQLVVHKLREVKTSRPCRCPRRHFGLRCFAFVLPMALLLM